MFPSPHARGARKAGSAILRPQDVFATSLYTGNGGTQNIATGFPPDFEWIKTRTDNAGEGLTNHFIFDKLRGPLNRLNSDTTNGENSLGNTLTSFDANGFALGPSGYVNTSGNTYVGWGAKRASKFFDIVTYTGNGTSGRQIPHGLGIVPGMVVVKRLDVASQWIVSHRSLSNQVVYLNLTAAAEAAGQLFGSHTGSIFTVGENNNFSGARYVAYLFAHDPDATNGIIQCGSGSGGATINLGWRPQFLLVKLSSGSDGNPNWIIVDTTRGWTGSADKLLFPNTSGDEASGQVITPNATGFRLDTASGNIVAGATYIYLAIRAPII